MWFGELCLICPWIIWGFLFVLLKKIRYTKKYALHFASDVTTAFLLFSMREIVLALFHYDIGVSVLIGAIVLAMIMVVYEWKIESELDTSKVFKKIWRILFVILTIAYILIILVFIIMWGIQLFN